MKMKNFELQRVENLGSTTDSIGVDHSNRGQLYKTSAENVSQFLFIKAWLAPG